MRSAIGICIRAQHEWLINDIEPGSDLGGVREQIHASMLRNVDVVIGMHEAADNEGRLALSVESDRDAHCSRSTSGCLNQLFPQPRARQIDGVNACTPAQE